MTSAFVLSFALLAGVLGGWVYGGLRIGSSRRTIVTGLALFAALFTVGLLAGGA